MTDEAMQNQRIKLAEAVYPDLWVGDKWLSMKNADGSRGFNIRLLPDPENDANDDYAVLEWAKTQGDEFWLAFREYFTDVRADWNIWNYEKGLFARAALKVIE